MFLITLDSISGRHPQSLGVGWSSSCRPFAGSFELFLQSAAVKDGELVGWWPREKKRKREILVGWLDWINVASLIGVFPNQEAVFTIYLEAEYGARDLDTIADRPVTKVKVKVTATLLTIKWP